MHQSNAPRVRRVRQLALRSSSSSKPSTKFGLADYARYRRHAIMSLMVTPWTGDSTAPASSRSDLDFARTRTLPSGITCHTSRVPGFAPSAFLTSAGTVVRPLVVSRDSAMNFPLDVRVGLHINRSVGTARPRSGRPQTCRQSVCPQGSFVCLPATLESRLGGNRQELL